MQKIFETQGICSRAIMVDINEETGTVREVRFMGGCAGNTQGVASLVKGMKVSDVIERLEGIQCGAKGTSCPDQLAKALKEMQQ